MRENIYPKPRTGRECKKTGCARHSEYLAWENWKHGQLSFCMNCKYAHVSQYKKGEQQ